MNDGSFALCRYGDISPRSYYPSDFGAQSEALRAPGHWLARVDAVFGPLLKLSFVGRNKECKQNEPANPKQHIWHDLTQKRLFPLG